MLQFLSSEAKAEQYIIKQPGRLLNEGDTEGNTTGKLDFLLPSVCGMFCLVDRKKETQLLGNLTVTECLIYCMLRSHRSTIRCASAAAEACYFKPICNLSLSLSLSLP